MIQEDNNSTLFTTCLKGTESQFTGLTDKNSNEIYEGDIVQKVEEDMDVFNNWSPGEMKSYNNDELEIPFKITKTDYVTLKRFVFWLKNESFGYEGEDLEDSSDWEIIGNIHQHAHLLNN